MISEKDIEKFIRDFGDIILQRDREALYSGLVSVREKDSMIFRKSKHGLHQMQCVWANDNADCGPDTCGCFFLERRIIEADRIIQKYKNLMNRMINVKENE